MNESENYLDQLLNAVDGRSDLNDSDPVNPEEIESKEQMPQKSTRETIDIPDSNDLFMDQFEQELRKDNDPDEFLKQFEQELDRDESSQGVTKATQPMLDDIDQIMESVNQEAANDTAEMAASAVEKTAEQKEDTAEVKNDEDASEDGIDDLAIDDIGIDDFGLDNPETENEKAVSDEDDELMRILSGTGEDSEIPEADNAKAEVQPDDGGKEEKKPKKQGFLAKLSKLLFGDDEPDEEEISGMQAEPAVTEMSMDDMDILKELEGSSDGDKKGRKEKKKKEKKKKEKAPKQPKEKKVKPKKEKKPKPPAEPDNTPPLPKVPVILVFVMAASILVLVLAGTHLLGYSNSFADADQAFAEGRYSDAFQAVAGEKVKEKDTDTYEKYRFTAMVSAEYEAYESMMDAKVYDMALDSLIRTVQRYDKYLQDAETYGCRGEFDKIESAAETALQQDFGLTAEDARTMYALSNKETYSKEIYKVLEKAGLSEVTE
jgi:hypothetical protein